MKSFAVMLIFFGLFQSYASAALNSTPGIDMSDLAEKEAAMIVQNSDFDLRDLGGQILFWYKEMRNKCLEVSKSTPSTKSADCLAEIEGLQFQCDRLSDLHLLAIWNLAKGGDARAKVCKDLNSLTVDAGRILLDIPQSLKSKCGKDRVVEILTKAFSSARRSKGFGDIRDSLQSKMGDYCVKAMGNAPTIQSGDTGTPALKD